MIFSANLVFFLANDAERQLGSELGSGRRQSRLGGRSARLRQQSTRSWGYQQFAAQTSCICHHDVIKQFGLLENFFSFFISNLAQYYCINFPRVHHSDWQMCLMVRQ